MHFKKPSRILICAASKAGKTVLTQKIVANRNWLFGNGPPFKKVIWVCNRREFAPNGLDDGVEVVEEIPEELERNTLIVLDDQMTNLNKSIVDLFIIKSHHMCISIILIAQNLFFNSKLFREISLQAEYLIVLKNPRDINQFARFCVQLAGPGKPAQTLHQVYKKATADKYGYLLIDLTSACNDVFRYKTNIFNKNWFISYIINNEDVRQSCEPAATENSEKQVFIAKFD